MPVRVNDNVSLGCPTVAVTRGILEDIVGSLLWVHALRVVLSLRLYENERVCDLEREGDRRLTVTETDNDVVSVREAVSSNEKVSTVIDSCCVPVVLPDAGELDGVSV